MTKKNIVIQYPFIALYRIPVFKSLASQNNFKYTFWSGKNSPYGFLKSSFDMSDLDIVEIPLTTIKLPLSKKLFEFQFKSILQLIKDKPDVYILLGNPNSITSWLSIITARLLGIITLSWSHGYLFDETGVKSLIRKFYYKLSHGHLLYGNNAKDIMLRKGFSESELDVIYNSLDYTTQAQLRDKNNIAERNKVRDKYNVDEDGIVLIAIGRLLKKLKLEQAIKAISESRDKKLYLIIVGDGSEKENLHDLAVSLGVSDRVVFYGECHNEEELALLYNASDMSVVMGKVGLSAMHSLAYGVPMITNNSMHKHFPEVEAIIENKTGWFFEEDDIGDFINKIKRIDYKGKVYNNCIDVIEQHYTPEKQVHFIESAINKHLNH